MADSTYEIDIEAGHEAEEMQVDREETSSSLNRKGRGFGRESGASHYAARNGRTGVSGNPSHATAVRCKFSLYFFREVQRLIVC